MMGPRCFVFLALPVALLVAGIAPAVGLAQPVETHGEVSQVSGDQVIIQLNEPTTVSDAARGRVFAQGETSTAVAEVTVQSTRGTLVLGRIAEELGQATVQTGQRVIFPALRTGATGGANAIVSLESVPKGATVHLVAKRNGRTLGTTPTLAKLPPGSHRLRFRKSGYIPLDRTVTVRPDTILGVRVTLKALDQPVVAQKGTLSVRPSPDSAVVFVDGSKVGTGRAQVPVSEGAHQVRATAHGYTAKAESLTVEGGELRRVAIDLSRDTGALRVTSTPTQAFVSVDGVQVGRTPLTTTQPAGSHMVVVKKSGYTAAERSVTVTKGAEDTLRLALRRPLDVELAAQQEGPVQNPQLTREDDEVQVQYALPTAEEPYEVSVELSLDRGMSYETIPGEVLSGDVGDKVTGGPNRSLRWDALEQYTGGLKGEKHRIRLVVEKVSSRNFPGRPGVVLEASLTPTLTAGSGVGGEEGGIAARVGYATESVAVLLTGFQAGFQVTGPKPGGSGSSDHSQDIWGLGPRLDIRLAHQGDDWPIAMHTTLDYIYGRSSLSRSETFRRGGRLQQTGEAQTHSFAWGGRAYYVFSLADNFEIIPEVSWNNLAVSRSAGDFETEGLYDLEQKGERTTVSFGGATRAGLGVFLGSRNFGVHLKAVGYLSGAGIGLQGGLRF